MIALDPVARPTFEALLHNVRGTVFPETFYSFLHSYVASINELPTASLFAFPPPASAAAQALLPTMSTASHAPVKGGTSTPVPQVSDTNGGGLPSDADNRMERIWADYESVEPYLVQDAVEETVMDVRVDYTQDTTSLRAFHVGIHFCRS